MSTKEINVIEKKRRIAKGRVTRTIRMLKTLVDENSDDVEELTSGLQTLDVTYKGAEEAHEELVLASPEDEEDASSLDAWIESLHDDVCTTRRFIREHIRHVTNTPKEITESSPVNAKVDVPGDADPPQSPARGEDKSVPKPEAPLPVIRTAPPMVRYKLDLPRFSGMLKDYRQFRTTFRTLVDSDQTDTNTKLHVLKGRLAYVPAKLICNIEDYHEAWEKLDRAFGRDDQVTDVCYQEIDSLRHQRKGDAAGFLTFAATVQDIVVQLRNAGCHADLESKGLLKTIFQKLADEDKERWGRDVREGRSEESVIGLSNWLEKESVVKSQAYSLEPTLSKSKMKSSANAVHAEHKDWKCCCCREKHLLPDCPQFKAKTVNHRWNIAKDNRCCFSCLRQTHTLKECRFKRICNIEGCQKKHHPLLHNHAATASATTLSSGQAVLPVIQVMVFSPNGNCQEGNLLIDTGAQVSIVRKEFAKRLGLQGKRSHINLSVVGGKTKSQTTRKLNFEVRGLHEDQGRFRIEAFELEQICSDAQPLDLKRMKRYEHLKDLQLSYHAGPIDILLGVDHPYLQVAETRRGHGNSPVALKTPLGWTIFGKMRGDVGEASEVLTVSNMTPLKPVDLTAFWETEAFGVTHTSCSCKPFVGSAEDRLASEMLQKSCKKVGDRYEIAMPWKRDPMTLRDNYSLALKRLESTERKLQKNKDFAEAYDLQIMEYEKRGFARKLTKEEIKNYEGPKYHIAHHAVLKEKSSTPIRIVFDSSAQFMGSSLNDFLMKGPDLLNSLFGVLLRFREEKIALCTDISKMFNQIKLPVADQHVHRFLWRNMEASREPDVYMMERVSFGDKPAPAMAQTVLQRVADDNREKYPLAAESITRNAYMDDICDSVATIQDAEQLSQQITQALKCGGFSLKSWTSNEASLDVMETQQQLQDKAGEFKEIGPKEEKILGAVWDPDSDTITFKVKELKEEKLTKRHILSRIARIFDPIGLASAFMIRAKIGMQNLWSKGLAWDDPISQEDQEWWSKLFKEMSSLTDVRFSRCLTPKNAISEPSLHIFCDASDNAFAACAYLRWEIKGVDPESRIVAAKTRVAPLKRLSIPRLELQAAVLGTRLAKSIIQETRLKISETFYWSDSTVTLAWIKSQATSYKPFVAVRIGEIQSNSNPSQWRYCPTAMNVADQASRGVKVSNLSGTWQHGPDFLRKSQDEWPKNTVNIEKTDEEKRRIKMSCVVSTDEDVLCIDQYDDWEKLRKITAKVLRFINVLRRGDGDVDLCDDLEKAENLLIKKAQIDLQEKVKKGEFKQLTPFTDENGIIRVGGRITEAPLPYDQRHPILLPYESKVSYLLMKDSHMQVQHAGAERVLAQSRLKFWIIRGRNLAKKISSKCVTCRRLREPAQQQQMSNLPDIRLKPFTPPFYHTGVDYFGPIIVKGGGRNRREKRYGVLFTCLNTRAIHLDVAADMSTPTFLQALRRFMARRGQPRLIISDNGSNFVGAYRELRNMIKGFDQEILQEFCAAKQIKWRFNTPQAPHHGGVFESMVKLAKKAMQAVIGEQVLTPEELNTYLCEVENLVNSRPLGPLTSDPNDGLYITPNHLLLGRASASVPQGPFDDRCSPKLRFQFVQSLTNAFWRRWTRNYLPTLMSRKKWTVQRKQIQVGDIVLLVDQDRPRGKWQMAVVTNCFPGNDGNIRSVEVKSKNGLYVRPITKLCLILPADRNE